MKIAVDGTLFTASRYEGIQTYARELLAHLAAREPGDSFLYLFCSLRRSFDDLALPTGAHCSRRLVLPLPGGLLPRITERLAYEIAFPRAADRERADVFHGLSHQCPRPARTCRTVVTVHDVFSRAFPPNHTPAGLRYYDRWHRLAVARADALITVSEATRHDLLRHFRVDEGKVHVVPEAASAAFRPDQDAAALAAVRERHRLERPFVLAHGALSTRKPSDTLLRAFAAVRREMAETDLVFFSAGDAFRARYAPLVRELGLDGVVRFVGPVPTRDLAALYALATAFVYPSLYEGFGLPVLEAMQCGTPVLTGIGSALDEVGGDAVLHADPRSVEDLAATLRRLLENPALRDDLRVRGLRRAAAYSWDRCALETRAVYERVVGRA